METPVLTPPLSKSDAQRALVLADIVGHPLELGDELPVDVQVLRDGLAALHRGTEQQGVAGTAGRGRGWAESTIDCRDGGAPFRFLLTQAALTPGHVTHFTGTPRLGERPHAPLIDALLRVEGLIIELGDPWPVTVRAPARVEVTGFEVTGAQSSQFASSLLLGAARVAATSGHPCSVEVRGVMASAGYYALTRSWVERAGFAVQARGGADVVEAGTRPAHFPAIPGDWSALSYLLLLAWKNSARVSRIERNTGHPDEAVVQHLASVGLRLEGDRVVGAPSGGLDVDASACPDAVPALAALACVLPKPSRFRHVDVLRHKESDRVDGIRDFVRRVGASAHVEGGALTIAPASVTRDFEFDARADHRLAMSAATLASLADVRLSLKGGASVAKSFPGFWREAGKVGVQVEQR